MLTTYFQSKGFYGLVSRDPPFMSKPFHMYDCIGFTHWTQHSKTELWAACWCRREAFCTDRLCLYPHVWNTRITFQQGVEEFLQNPHQINSLGKETAYVLGMCLQPLIKHLESSWWLSKAAWQRDGFCREQSHALPPMVCNEMMTGDGNFTHHPQKTEVFVFWIY